MSGRAAREVRVRLLLLSWPARHHEPLFIIPHRQCSRERDEAMRSYVRTGFAMIELLTVAVVPAILAGLLFPGLAHCREVARRGRCVCRPHQLALPHRLNRELTSR